MISSLLNWTKHPQTDRLLFQTLLNLIQCKLVLFSLNSAKLIPNHQLSFLINLIQAIYHFSSPHRLDPKLLGQMSSLGS